MIYNQFAWYYDSLMEPQFYEDYFLYLKEKLPFYHNALDLGCGTGTLTARLTSLGQNIIGIDLSEEMITLAKDKFPALRFEVHDMCTYKKPKTFDLIVCLCDSLNYVLGKEQQYQVLKQCYENLTIGGYLVFDVHSQKKINETFLCYQEEEEDEDFYFFWSVKKTAPYQITHTVIIEDLATDVRMEEKHVQESYPKDWYKNSLSTIGFQLQSSEDPFHDGQRHVFIAKKEENQ